MSELKIYSFHRESESFAPWLLNRPRAYEARDVTAIICIRAHRGNPWVLERLDLLAGFYQPAPTILIVDFGSEEPFAGEIRSRCSRHGFIHHRVDDDGVFSLSIARNEGAMRADTDLLYFSDIDFFSAPDHFSRLAGYATLHDFSIVRDIVLNIPAYHLRQDRSEEFAAMPGERRQHYIEQLGILAAEKARGGLVEFIAPYSNNFLCTRDFFMIAGGYDAGFRGHGSEDFELMVRFALHSRHVPLPEHVKADIHAPTRRGFFKPRAYAGFRRLGEAFSFRAESAGFRTFHLWHPTPKNDPWRSSNDWGRRQLAKALGRYVDDPSQLVHVDHLPHAKSALCICKAADHGGYYLPFRALGYKLHILSGDGKDEIDAAREMIHRRKVDAFMIFNPYMKSHAPYLGLFNLARESAIQVVVVERGALPATVYYATDVSYNDPDFLNYDASPPEAGEQDLLVAEALCARICEGSWTLENLESYEKTKAARSAPGRTKTTRVFIPLQLADDMAVTCFVSATQRYSEFEQAITQVARSHPDLHFLVKAHPLMRRPFHGAAENLTVCRNDENVHALIDACDVTICYNSGVGLLSLIHGKPTITIGNAFYNVAHTGMRAASLEDAAKLVASGACRPPSRRHLLAFVAWLATRKYSFFKADDEIQHIRHRNSHAYKNIMISQLNWNGIRLPLGRVSALARIGRFSYVNGRLGLGIGARVPSLRLHGTRLRASFRRFLLAWSKERSVKRVTRDSRADAGKSAGGGGENAG